MLFGSLNAKNNPFQSTMGLFILSNKNCRFHFLIAATSSSAIGRLLLPINLRHGVDKFKSRNVSMKVSHSGLGQLAPCANKGNWQYKKFGTCGPKCTWRMLLLAGIESTHLPRVGSLKPKALADDGCQWYNPSASLCEQVPLENVASAVLCYRSVMHYGYKNEKCYAILVGTFFESEVMTSGARRGNDIRAR